MGKLAKKILAAREFDVVVGDWTFVCRRPDAMSSTQWVGLDGTALAEKILGEGVVGWKGVLERDLIGAGGSDLAVEFDSEDFLVWSRDRPEIWGPIVEATLKSVSEWADRVEAGRKN